ncbi:uncharacterized protein si:dkey-65l23.2 [Chanodichthys erythropterus]|uniref:uncharacterized protein si:dkey-65l23.2 n=1 Tax=Chanodichthys erythropterus TaxID=933992 RepID=UPI00351ECBB8
MGSTFLLTKLYLSQIMEKIKQCYALIEFPDKSTDVVPENWVFGQKCYWPNYNLAKLKTAVKRREPVHDEWKLLEPVRLLKKCETLEKAQKMLKKYVDCDIHTSEVTSDEEGHDERTKRKKRPNPRFLNFIENDSEQDDIAPKKNCLAAAPIINFPESDISFESSPAVSSLSLLERQVNYTSSPTGAHQDKHQGAHQVTNYRAHQEKHQGAHQDTHYGAHQDTHQDTNYRAQQHTHYGVHQDTNYRAHQDKHQGANQDTNYGAHQDTNYGAHQDTNYGAHQDKHQGANQDTNYGAHQDTNYGAHQDTNYRAHQDTNYGAHQDTNYRAHQDTNYGAHQDTNYGAHQDTNYRAHQDTNYGAHQDIHHGGHQDTHYGAHRDAHRGAHQGTLSEPVNELSPFKRNVLKVLMDIKNELKEQRAMLQSLQGVPVPAPDTECSLSFPLQSNEDFDALERMDETEKNRLVCLRYTLVGGHKLDETVRKMLSYIFTNKLASSFNWAGRGEKRSFEASNLSKIMFRALRSTPQGKEASKAEFSEAVKKWLRYAPDREGGSGRRSSV